MRTISVMMASSVLSGNMRLSSLLKKVPSHRKRTISMISDGGTVVVGRRTWRLIGWRLKRKKNPSIIVSSNSKFKAKHPELTFASSFKEALELADQRKSVWVLGGIRTFKLALKYADFVHHTFVFDEGKLKKQAFLPLHNSGNWRSIAIAKVNEGRVSIIDGKPMYDQCDSVCVTFKRTR